MDRRHFVQLSTAAAVSLLFNNLTFAAGINTLINAPDEAWAQIGLQWVRLKPSGGNLYTYRDIEVSIVVGGNSSGVYIRSPKTALNAIRLKWKYPGSCVG